jgi:hypothetical protein
MQEGFFKLLEGHVTAHVHKVRNNSAPIHYAFRKALDYIAGHGWKIFVCMYQSCTKATFTYSSQSI